MFGATRRRPWPVWPLMVALPALAVALTYRLFPGRESFAVLHTWAWFDGIPIPAQETVQEAATRVPCVT